jgi:hypothetical protein
MPAQEGVAKREKTSCPRKRASRKLRKSNWFWTSAFAEVTEKRALATPSDRSIATDADGPLFADVDFDLGRP